MSQALGGSDLFAVLARALAARLDMPLDALRAVPAAEAAFGDVVSHAALRSAGALARAPRDLAEELAEQLRGLEAVADVAVAGPGFLNIRFETSALLAALGAFQGVTLAASLGPEALERAVAAVQMEAIPPEYEELARLYVLTQRPEGLGRVTLENVRAPQMSNPAFALHYCASKLKHLRGDGAVALSAEARPVAVRLLNFPSLLQRVQESAEPFRLGLYLANLARDIVELGAAERGRGEKAIYGPLIEAAEIVFSQGFAMLGSTPLEEIA